MKRILKEYYIDLLIVLFGILLLLEQFDVGWSLAWNLRRLFEFLTKTFSNLFGSVTGHLQDFNPSNLIGWGLLIMTLVVVLLRLRWRFQNTARWSERVCPLCGSNLRRMHRTHLDRFMTGLFFVPAHRYRCSSADCTWSGLRKPGRHHRQREDILGDVE